MKSQFSILSFFCLLAVAMIAGCGGGSGEAEYDPSSAPAYSEEEAQSAEDYEAQMKKEQEEQYGN